MKKSILTALVIISFLLGNINMLAGIVRLFGLEAIKPHLNDLIYQKVCDVLYGPEESLTTRPRPLKYDQLRVARPRIPRTRFPGDDAIAE